MTFRGLKKNYTIRKAIYDFLFDFIYGLSRGIIFFDPRGPLGVKGQGQTLKTSKSNISKTVRDREMVSIEVK